ncbi:MAG: hypothetical protein K8R91_03750 [Phycisphaerae bacterium]|nr:hypothetical protein [Phycisphaerae bacterium]
MLRSMLIIAALLLSGCAQNGLVTDLAERGVEPSTTTMLRFVGSEADVGSNVKVVITDKEIIDKVWRSIKESTPTERWYASGYRKMEFYITDDSKEPTAVVFINASDACHIEGAARYRYDSEVGKMVGMYKCQDLNEFVMKYLKNEYRRIHAEKN